MTPASNKASNISRENYPIFHVSPEKKKESPGMTLIGLFGVRFIGELITVAKL